MSAIEKLKESREYERFQVHYGVVAALECETRVRAGLVNDISRGGLSFRYLESKNEPKCSSQELKISWNTKKDFYIDSVPCRIASDQPLSSKEYYSYLPMRKCSVTFGEMTPEQMSQIEYFIKNFTKGPISEPPNISLVKRR